MASVVFQGLQSCLIEPQLIHEKCVVNGDRKSRKKSSFLDFLENPSPNALDRVQKQVIYVHPMAKICSLALSTKSLEMCTESLGSETGSEVSESGDEFSSWFGAIDGRSKSRGFDRKKSTRRGGGLPPPLTTISGSDGRVTVRPRRAGGRLVIKAVSVSDCGTKFKAERTHGRLRLSFLKDYCVNSESGGVETEEVGKEEGGGVKNWCRVGSGGGGSGWWDMDGKGEFKNSVEDFTEFEKRMLTRCKEGENGNKVMANWCSFWVAIS